MSPVELVLTCAAITAAISVIGGGVLWLVAPRFRAMVEDVVEDKVGRVESQLGDDPDTIGRHAKVAARAASELPRIREDLTRLAEAHAELDEWRHRTERRLTSVEGALLALLGPELRRRLAGDLGEHPTTERKST